jgi:hypothetical protein
VFVLADRQNDKRPVRLRYTHCFGLCPGDVNRSEESAVDARRLQALMAEDAGAVREGERHHNQIALLDVADVGTGGFDDADRLVAHHAAATARLHGLVGQRSLPQMQALVTRTTASVASMMVASGTFSMRTSPAAYITVARISSRPPALRRTPHR